MTVPGRPREMAWADLAADAFPFRIDALVYPGTAAERVVWSREVSGPGVLDVPGKAPGSPPITVVMTLATGEVWTISPTGERTVTGP